MDANGIDSLTAISIESLPKYPCGDSLMLLANISSLSSDFGSRPVDNRNSGLLGNGALIVPLPAFLPSRINHVFRTCTSEIFRFLFYRLFDEIFNYLDGSCEIDDFYFVRIDLIYLS
jgi:hypothetical protein